MPILGKGSLLNDRALVAVEHFYKKKIPERLGCLVRKREYRYGDTVLSLYEKAE